jgi:amino acid transporter
VLIAGIISYIAIIIANSIVIDYRDYEFQLDWASIFTSLPILVGSYFFYTLGNCIASIAKNVYIQKEICVATVDKEKFEVVLEEDQSTSGEDQSTSGENNKIFNETWASLYIAQLKKNMKDDEVIVRINYNGKIEKRKISEIEESIKEGNSDKFIVIYKKN